MEYVRTLKVFLGFTLLLQCSGCANLGDQQQTGALTGGILGGLLGSQLGHGHGRTAAVIGGSVVGSLIGSSLGKDMDEMNRMRFARALETTPVHHTRSWEDRRTGYHYTVQPLKTYHKKGRLCRRYSSSVLIDGRLQTAKGRACRNAHGHWVIQN